MNPRRKIITQCVLCCLVFVCAKGISFLPNEQVQKAQATVQRQQTHYTEDDWKRFASGFCRKIKKHLWQSQTQWRRQTLLTLQTLLTRCRAYAGCRVKTARSQSTACGRGIVLTSGGLTKSWYDCEKFNTKNRYPLAEIFLPRNDSVQNDAVKKGDVIGYYDKTCGKDFYYDKEENYRN